MPPPPPEAEREAAVAVATEAATEAAALPEAAAVLLAAADSERLASARRWKRASSCWCSSTCLALALVLAFRSWRGSRMEGGEWRVENGGGDGRWG
mgnify:CR=1 FL=1